MARLRFCVAGRIHKLSERDGRQLLDYTRRLGVESLAARIEEEETAPQELTRDEKMALGQAIDRLWREEEGIEGLSASVERLRDALHDDLDE